MVEVNVWVVVHEDGEYTIHGSADEVTHPDGMASRVVKVTVNVPAPKPVELVATVADEVGTGDLQFAWTTHRGGPR
ncbi:hypothetical protein VT84_13865 [Gemmata sp. SH-PL17]|uniref:hypothetical protein n=1 Tax=Gemmata sp. SH-PL17 TaxID=1630693 RepID=UPI00078BA5EC|nr:hypothetical protein [Gemmata sp. SH-PL17]AMV25480.1 hypothetical protein VT84_13865 [Gemmata sp. SH-PL17]